MFIQTEPTPNPATLKFIPGKTVLGDGTVDFRDKAEAGGSPLAQRLFAVDGVAGVFLGSDGTGEEVAEHYDAKDEETVKTIKELLDTRVRPAVANDGGDITFRGFKDGVVFLHMRGACSGCPSSTATLRHGIENLLKHFCPDVQEVRPI